MSNLRVTYAFAGVVVLNWAHAESVAIDHVKSRINLKNPLTDILLDRPSPDMLVRLAKITDRSSHPNSRRLLREFATVYRGEWRQERNTVAEGRTYAQNTQRTVIANKNRFLFLDDLEQVAERAQYVIKICHYLNPWYPAELMDFSDRPPAPPARRWQGYEDWCETTDKAAE